MTYLILGKISVEELFKYQQKFNSYAMGVVTHDKENGKELSLFGASTFIVSKEQNIFEHQLFKYVLKNKPMILTHSATWGNSSEFYTQLFADLTGRSVQSLEYHLIDLGVDLKISSKEINRLLSIKDVLPLTMHPKLDERNRTLLAVMGELLA